MRKEIRSNTTTKNEMRLQEETGKGKSFKSLRSFPYAFAFSLTAASLSALFILLSIYSNFNVLTVSTSSLQQMLSAVNASTETQLLITAGVSALKQALFLILPLMAISMIFLFILAFRYLNSINREKRMIGAIFTIIITLIPILGLFIYLPISPLIVITDVSYIGVFNSVLTFSTYLSFILFLVFGIAAGIIEIYKDRR